MRETILTRNLKIGMYITLSVYWVKPPFIDHDADRFAACELVVSCSIYNQ